MAPRSETIQAGFWAATRKPLILLEIRIGIRIALYRGHEGRWTPVHDVTADRRLDQHRDARRRPGVQAEGPGRDHLLHEHPAQLVDSAGGAGPAGELRDTAPAVG